MGYPDLRIILIDHPLGGTKPDEALAKVEGANARLVDFFER